MLRVSFKSPRTHSGVIKIAHPTVCTIPEIRRYPAAACAIQNSKEACFSWAHPFPPPLLIEASLQPHVWNRLEIYPTRICICALLTTKTTPTALGICIFHLNVSKQRSLCSTPHKNRMVFIWYLSNVGVRA